MQTPLASAARTPVTHCEEVGEIGTPTSRVARPSEQHSRGAVPLQQHRREAVPLEQLSRSVGLLHQPNTRRTAEPHSDPTTNSTASSHIPQSNAWVGIGSEQPRDPLARLAGSEEAVVGDRPAPVSEIETGRRSLRIRGVEPECRGLYVSGEGNLESDHALTQKQSASRTRKQEENRTQIDFDS